MATRPFRTTAQRSRLNEDPARDGDIPAYFSWDDGSEYEVFENPDGTFTRRFHGPLFKAPDWVTVVFGDAVQE